MQQTGKQVPKVIAGALAVFAFGIVFSPDEAAAQIQPWEDSGYVSVNYAYEVADRSFSESLSATVYDETATYTANHSGGGGGGFDVGAGWRVWRNLAAGVTVTSFSTSSGAAVSGAVPHPLFYNRPRNATFNQTDLEYTELGVHLQAVWVMPLSEKITVSVGAGPSFFSVKQALISTASPSELGAPFNVTSIAATFSTTSASAFGGNAGLDLTYMFTERLGGGIFARWAGGSASLAVSGGNQSIDVGGVQSGAGIRVTF